MEQSRRMFLLRSYVMLTKEQEYKITKMVTKYCIGMKKHIKADDNLIRAWGIRYRIAMEQRLQKQGKR